MVDYQKTRDEVEQRKAQITERRKQIPIQKAMLDAEDEQLKRELIGLDQILDGLAFMDSKVSLDFEPVGFTDSIRKILSETQMPLTPPQIRYALEQKGITGSSSKNLLINVHKVIERIESELIPTLNSEGKPAYKRKLPWINETVNFWGSLGSTQAAANCYASMFLDYVPLSPDSPQTEVPTPNALAAHLKPALPSTRRPHRQNASYQRWKQAHDAKMKQEGKPTIYENIANMALQEAEKKEKK
jgi:hypothetical protein